MHPSLYIFLISCTIILYNYAGYAVLAWLIGRVAGNYRTSTASPGDFKPTVSFIVAAFNEETTIPDKIRNSLQLDYPAHAIEFIFVTDGSTDQTPAIVSSTPGIRLLHESARKGKSAAVNRAVLQSRNDILIFSDANTMLNTDAINNIARHYHDPLTGGVAGEKKVISQTSTPTDSGDSEGIYWRYESRLKQIDSDFYSVVGAAGELFSLRRNLYTPLPENTVLDDFVLSLRVAGQGFRIVYEPAAYAMELPSSSIKEEQKRKVRISAGGFQAIGMLTGLLAFWRHPRLTYLYFSHRVLRWTLSPLCLILAWIFNLILAFQPSANPILLVTAAMQTLFYGLAALYRLPLPPALKKIAKIPYYFTFMNVSVLLGFIRFCRGSQSAIWEKAKRMENAPIPLDH
jgi:cellulose synthase/poly-beta-1,6-N-acetylglucosamine synthase-like glycosyltransferase